jgi:hypothetical protein
MIAMISAFADTAAPAASPGPVAGSSFEQSSKR